ncbi:uncharacterized protein LOC110722497 [Chenopodium quinoa]|uniref:uncharacterized protein LOC110722497 n=1 Tax=Chenopodium quinoa TaxID=63459 RepID=UPI000B79735D|nr:uncharacterized protein LOC110722497 [Chenopodium quinoa]
MAAEEAQVRNNGGNQTTGGNLDPFFIASSDNPISSLVAVQFSGLKEPDVSHSDYHRWKRADYMVVSWILSSMSAELADDFAYIDSAIELWSELHERFGQSNGPLVYQLKKEIDALKQENLSIIAYYCKIKKLWDELQSLRAFPTCTCGALTRCTCQFLKKLADLEGEDRLMQFLLGLNSGFDSTITNILSMDPLPTINRAFSITQQIEKQKEVSGSVEHVTESSAMAARRMIRNGVQKFGQNYSKTGRRRNSGSKRVGGQSNGQRFAANVHASQDADSPLDSDGNIDNSRISSDLLSAICQEVMKTMKGKQSVGETRSTFANFAGNDSLTCAVSKTGENCLWIVDSGAFDHMVFDERMFVCKMFLDKPIRVVLPDGTYKFVKMDPSNEEMVGHGRRQNGLYYFTKEVTEKTEAAGSVFNENNAVCCNSVGNKQISVLPNKTATGDISKENKVSLDVLHARLGHVSLSKMKQLHVCDCTGLKEYNCAVCFNAKQHKFPFHVSTSRADAVFDLYI